MHQMKASAVEVTAWELTRARQSLETLARSVPEAAKLATQSVRDLEAMEGRFKSLAATIASGGSSGTPECERCKTRPAQWGRLCSPCVDEGVEQVERERMRERHAAAAAHRRNPSISQVPWGEVSP